MKFLRINLGYILILIFSLVPSIYLLLTTNSTNTLNILSKVSALSGIVMFCFNFILSTRAKIIENIFMGLDKVYKAHRFVGIFALILLLVHPFLIFLRYQTTFTSLFIPPQNNIDVVSGMLALDIFLVVLFVTLFLKKIRYSKWRGIHKFLGLSLFLASLHVFLIPSDVSRGFLRIYILSFCILALISFIYRTLLFKLLVSRYRYIVTTVIPLNSTVSEISLKAVGKKMKYMNSQFAFFEFEDKYITSEIHPFTIASSTDEDSIRIIVKSSGDFTSKLNQLNPGTKVKIEGPYGEFLKHTKHTKALWIAGGIGITPFLSQIKEIKGKDITLIYAVSDTTDFIYLKELRESGIKLIEYNTEIEGRIDIDKICKYCDVLDRDIYMCGPIPMMRSLNNQLISKGVSRYDIHFEDFALK
jgi:predicted ferric reductase